MSLWRDELKASKATIACLVALAAVALASMSRVIEPGYVVWALAALAIGGLFAFTFGSRSLGIGFGLLVVLSGLTLPALFVRHASSGPLPTPDAYASVRKLIAAGFAGIAKATPPVPAESKYLILVWLSFLLLGFLGAAWVVVRRPVGAVVSALAVLTFTGSVGEGAGRNVYAVLAIAATGGFFLAEGRHRIARWGGGRIAIPLWLGLPTLGAACVVAIGAPLVIGETPILRLDSPIRPRVVIIKPLSDIKRQLKVDPPLEVMRVTASRPTYWRLTSLDAYNGNEWVLEARPRDLRAGEVPAPKPPAIGDLLEQNYRLTSLLSPWLPAAYAATSVDSSAAVQVDEGSQTLLLRDKTQPGLEYTVTSRQPRVTQNLEADPKPVPDGYASIFGAIAKPIAQGARTPLDTARRLEAHFRTYRYDEDVAAGHTVARLQQFLRDKAGYCEQFAATMTLMLRGLGVEARVGVGFLPGSNTSGEYVVSTRDAHAWVEANIPGAGWTTFDPTPGRGGTSVVPPNLQEQLTQPKPIPQVTAVPDPTPQPQDLPKDVTEQRTTGGIPMAVLYALLAGVFLGVAPVAKSVRRSRRKRGPPDAVVAGAYGELIDRAHDLGWRHRTSETQREFVARALTGDAHALQLAELTAHALYGLGSSDAEEASQAWAAAGVAMKHLNTRSPWWRRVIAIEDPRTFLPDRRPNRGWRRVRLRVAAVFGRA
jgi:transglutaminase-like putative cysteine protease